MKWPQLKPGELVEIEWRDSAVSVGWMTTPELEFDDDDLTPIIRSVGFVIARSTGVVLLAGSLGFFEDGTIADTTNRMAIPLGCVEGVHALRRARS